MEPTFRVIDDGRFTEAEEEQVVTLLGRAFNGGPSGFHLSVPPVDHLRWKARDAPWGTSALLMEMGPTLIGYVLSMNRRILDRCLIALLAAAGAGCGDGPADRVTGATDTPGDSTQREPTTPAPADATAVSPPAPSQAGPAQDTASPGAAAPTLVVAQGDDDPRLRVAFADAADDFDAFHHRHPEIEQHHVGLVLFPRGNGLDAVAGLGDDVQIVLLVNDVGDAGTQQRVVVD